MVRSQVASTLDTVHMDVGLPVNRQHLTHSVIWVERSKPV